MGTRPSLLAAPHHLAPHHQPQENHLETRQPLENHLETHPSRRCLEVQLTRQFLRPPRQLIRTLGQEYHQQGGLHLRVINLLQGLMYLRVLLF